MERDSIWSRAKSWWNSPPTPRVLVLGQDGSPHWEPQTPSGSTTTKTSQVDPEGSHSYVQVIPLGKTTEVGTPKEVMDRVKKNPNGYFPMTRVDGSLKKEGDVGYLKPFGIGKGNPVKVVYTDETTLTLEAEPGHFFQGTAQHATFEQGGYTYYQVAGMGPEGRECVAKQYVNNNFPWTTAIMLKGTAWKEERQ
jgi:hypothetical protein